MEKVFHVFNQLLKDHFSVGWVWIHDSDPTESFSVQRLGSHNLKEIYHTAELKESPLKSGFVLV
jgi:hypothetical protein